MMNSFLISAGIFASTYVLNAVIAPLYSNNCVQIMNYNSPPCALGLGILTSCAYINYWIFYISIVSGLSFLFTKMGIFRK